ncbi:MULTISPECIES: hypothetical protein [unclassified Microcystis]|uniref:hypothetical protein n=1 Tax=unclassified Microcystis TaxID=2643300 RepID=UPI0022C0FBBC|nr:MULTISPECIES: hypothetical protein [unclassified Microcystis]MCA2693501.1 hypothetical protein [Microcystis sp. M034S2]MCA2750838.1 hypothetical protein [Microcystis sp. M144S2]MCZ8201665.1 hypothetical protein [Microcystis sp. LE19-55.1A]MCZ8308969.1 hypothetical protein [Microcystis sp. LE19-98.1E]
MEGDSDRWAHLDIYEQKLTAKVREDYDQIMGNNQDILGIAAQYEISEIDIRRAKDYAFGSGVSRYQFFPEGLMVAAWRRLAGAQGNNLDRMFLNHEIYESDLVINRGFSQQQAHLLAQKQYTWSDSIQQTR